MTQPRNPRDLLPTIPGANHDPVSITQAMQLVRNVAHAFNHTSRLPITVEVTDGADAHGNPQLTLTVTQAN